MADFFLLLILLGSVVFLIWFGYHLAKDELARAWSEVELARQEIAIELDALDRTHRINDVFFTAREQMRRAQQPRPQPVFVPGVRLDSHDSQLGPWDD